MELATFIFYFLSFLSRKTCVRDTSDSLCFYISVIANIFLLFSA